MLSMRLRQNVLAVVLRRFRLAPDAVNSSTDALRGSLGLLRGVDHLQNMRLGHIGAVQSRTPFRVFMNDCRFRIAIACKRFSVEFELDRSESAIGKSPCFPQVCTINAAVDF